MEEGQTDQKRGRIEREAKGKGQMREGEQDGGLFVDVNHHIQYMGNFTSVLLSHNSLH